MISIMIVEDEPPIARDLKKLIKAIHSDFEIIACVNNGLEAQSFLASRIPDVIFTDIRMPMLDGLELIKYLREHSINCEIVILSGYSDFSYAQKALQLQVHEYLLKPVQKSQLESLLHNLHNFISNKKKSLQQAYLKNLLTQKPCSFDFSIFNDFKYYVMLLCAGSFPSHSLDYDSPQRFFWEDLNFDHSFTTLFPTESELWIIDGKTVSEKIVIFSSFDSSLNTSSKILNLTRHYFRHSTLPITCVLSHPITAINETGTLFKELRSIMHKILVLGHSQFINLNMPKDSTSDYSNSVFALDSSDYNRLSQLIQKGRKSDFRLELALLIQSWGKNHCPQRWMDKMLRTIISLFQDFIPDRKSFDLLECDLQLNDVFAVTSDYTLLLDNCWYLFEHLFQLRSNTFVPDESIELIMLRIDNYIVAHVDEFVSTQTLSDMVGLVPSYLSKLFRDYKGMSPSEYIVHLRIEKAKELLLKNPAIFAKDIAPIIGYSDPLYFSKVFKKKTGLSLSDYKKNLL